MSGPTASILVNVHPSGVRGHVFIEVLDQGPVRLTDQEMARILMDAYTCLTREKPEADT